MALERPQIALLPETVANRIAAGEVVERPVAVIKELVENALDAGASRLEVEFVRGGKQLMRVADNGHGMTAEEAALALQRHATSKIRKVEDILSVGTFGFRGEALPSIASVSRFTLRSRTAEAICGNELLVEGGRTVHSRDHGMAGGTEVVVEHLFKHVPARRKFLRTDRTEAAHIIQTCRLLAIAHPEVAFRLIEDGHVVFDSARCPDRIQRIREILGKGRAAELFELPRQVRNGIEVSGWIGLPGVGRSTRSEMVTYVNQRPVDSRVLNYALVESYHRYLPRGRYPVAFLFIGVHDGQVDVNVHPTKREVKFRDEGQVRQAVMLTLVEALEAQAGKGLQGAVKVAGEPLDDAAAGAFRAAAAAEQRPAVPSPDPLRIPVAPVPQSVAPVPQSVAPVPPPAAPGSSGRAVGWRLQTILQATFGLFETAEGWVVVHGKAAYERVWCERIEKQLRDEERASQPLLVPGIMELPPIEAGLLADQLAFFSRMGFEIEPFGRHVYRLCSAPAWLGRFSPEAFVTDLLGRIRDRGIATGDRDAALRVVAKLAAMERSRGWQSTDRAAWQQLVDDLLGCEVPLLDTRGRPTLFELRGSELRKRFMLEGERRGGMEDG